MFTPRCYVPLIALLASFAIPNRALAAQPLPALNADASAVTVSGVSSGGYMAVQFQVVYSKIVSGTGVIAGGPYNCAEGSVWRALHHCMAPSDWFPVPDSGRLKASLEAKSRRGQIDSPEGLRDDRVWILSGGNDKTVDRKVVDALAESYGPWIAPSALRYLKLPDPGHAMLSAVDADANACVTTEAPFINMCPDPNGTGLFDAPKEIFGFLLGPPGAKGGEFGNLLPFDQHEFVAGRPDDAGLSSSGFVYIPAVCRTERCGIHIVFHGCEQSAEQIGQRFINGVGYNRWADRYRLIVVYPQTAVRRGFAVGSWRWIYNPKACWDWWGYTGSDYATRKAPQLEAVRKMVDRLAQPTP